MRYHWYMCSIAGILFLKNHQADSNRRVKEMLSALQQSTLAMDAAKSVITTSFMEN